jgi:hypothetical protein
MSFGLSLDAPLQCGYRCTRERKQPATAAAPQLTYRNGPLIEAAEVFTVFWGAAWSSALQHATTQEMDQLNDFILTSTLIDQLTECNVANCNIKRGKRTGTTLITSPVLHYSMNDTTIQRTLQHEIVTNNGFPQSTHTQHAYFVYFLPDVTVIQGGAGSGTAFCGYHDDINGQIFYAAMSFPRCAGCAGGLQPSDVLTSASPTSCARPSRKQFPARAGTTLTVRLATAWKPEKSAATRYNWNGPTKRISAFNYR